MPNWPLGLWPLAAWLLLLTVPRYHYTLVNVWHLAIRSWSWYRTPSHVTQGDVHWPGWGRRKWKLRAEQWRADQWHVRGRESSQLGAERPIVTSLLWQCHITTESVTTERPQCLCRAPLLTNIHICGTEPNNSFPRISTESMQRADDCVLKAFVTVKRSPIAILHSLQLRVTRNRRATVRIISHTIDT